jgi:F-type H+-transporting ATPase subunit delta
MRSKRQIHREANRLFRLCTRAGTIDGPRARHIVAALIASGRPGWLATAARFQRLVRLHRAAHSAEVQSATSLEPGIRAGLERRLVEQYGGLLETSFVVRPELIGGLRIRVASDVYDGSVRERLTALNAGF